ncbi:HAD family phosphatase [Paenibacillus sp. SM 69]|nr:HAD family phosphatase [Paenibacillus oleatilyticus]
MFTAFIFDMDGVIIDSEPLHFKVDMEVMGGLGVPITKEELEGYVGMTNPEMWTRIRLKYGLTPSVEDIIELQLKRKLAYLEASDDRPIEGITELLHSLHGTKRIGLASSSPRVFIEAVLNKFDLLSYFDFVISGEEVDHGKPAPDIYLKAAEMLGASPDQCIVLEDARHGVAAAKAAGMTCIGFQNANSGEQDLSKADWIVGSIRQIRLEELERLIPSAEAGA